ncbi:MAG: helix-turn-helix domain-containing protein [Microbacteriaceae bacterium]|nr:helix-turn-helix domain-containing protein [Microbacteriaceae bacterium]
MHFDPRDNLAVIAGLSSAILGAVHAIEGFGGNHLYRRTDAKIKRRDPDCLTLALPSVGSLIVEQDGRQSIVESEQMVFIDSSRPSLIAMRVPFRWQIVAIPKSALRLTATQLKSITAIPLTGTGGINRVVQEAIRTMVSQSTELEKDTEVERIGGHAIDLIATLINSAFAREVSVSGRSAVLRETVLAFVRRRHSDPLLNPAQIAHAHQISLRTLHSAFTAGPSLMETVRTLRLDLARTDLSNPRLCHLSIAQIAHAHGFASASDFSRAFRTRHGTTPSEYRDLPPTESHPNQFGQLPSRI